VPSTLDAHSFTAAGLAPTTKKPRLLLKLASELRHEQIPRPRGRRRVDPYSDAGVRRRFGARPRTQPFVPRMPPRSFGVAGRSQRRLCRNPGPWRPSGSGGPFATGCRPTRPCGQVRRSPDRPRCAAAPSRRGSAWPIESALLGRSLGRQPRVSSGMLVRQASQFCRDSRMPSVSP
jgi:hypothetical protein